MTDRRCPSGRPFWGGRVRLWAWRTSQASRRGACASIACLVLVCWCAHDKRGAPVCDSGGEEGVHRGQRVVARGGEVSQAVREWGEGGWGRRGGAGAILEQQQGFHGALSGGIVRVFLDMQVVERDSKTVHARRRQRRAPARAGGLDEGVPLMAMSLPECGCRLCPCSAKPIDAPVTIGMCTVPTTTPGLACRPATGVQDGYGAIRNGHWVSSTSIASTQKCMHVHEQICKCMFVRCIRSQTCCEPCGRVHSNESTVYVLTARPIPLDRTLRSTVPTEPTV